MSFPLNKRVDGVKVHSPSYSQKESGVDSVNVIRRKKDSYSLLLVGDDLVGNCRIATVRLLLQLKGIKESQLNSGACVSGCFKYAVIVDASNQDFGKVGRIAGGYGKYLYLDLLSSGTSISVMARGLRYIRSPECLFDHNPFTGEISDRYIVDDWTSETVNVEPPSENTEPEKPALEGIVGNDAITYKIQYVTSDGMLFGSTWEVNQYVDEQNKLRIHRKKMELLKTMAKEAGLEFEVNGSSIVLK